MLQNEIELSRLSFRLDL